MFPDFFSSEIDTFEYLQPPFVKAWLQLDNDVTRAILKGGIRDIGMLSKY